MKLYEAREVEYGTRYRIYNHYICDNCGTEYRKQKRLAEGATQEHFCSKECYTIKTSPYIAIVKCAHCGIDFAKPKSKLTSKSGLYFCCREHKDLGQSYIKEIQPNHYGLANGKYSYRAKAFSLLDNICNKCGYSNKDALEVHHKDKNRENNDISNLEILCANCHTLTHKYNRGQ